MMAGLSSLTWQSQIGLWGWVRLHVNLFPLGHQWTQVKPTISTLTQELSLNNITMWPCVMYLLQT